MLMKYVLVVLTVVFKHHLHYLLFTCMVAAVADDDSELKRHRLAAANPLQADDHPMHDGASGSGVNAAANPLQAEDHPMNVGGNGSGVNEDDNVHLIQPLPGNSCLCIDTQITSLISQESVG